MISVENPFGVASKLCISSLITFFIVKQCHPIHSELQPVYNLKEEISTNYQYINKFSKFIDRLNAYHGKSFILVSSPPTILSVTCTPQSLFDGKSSIVKVFGQHTSGLEPCLPHCEFLKNVRCSIVIIGPCRRRLYNERHCCKTIHFPSQLSGVLHESSIQIAWQMIWIKKMIANCC